MTLLAGSAAGQIIVEHNSGGNYVDVTSNPAFVVFPAGNGSGANLTLIEDSGVYRITTLTPSSQDIGVVTYNGTGSIEVLVADADNFSSSDLNPAARHFAGLGGSGTQFIDRFQLSVTGNVTGDIEAEYIQKIEAVSGTNAGTTIRQLGPKSAVAIISDNGALGADMSFLDSIGIERIQGVGISGDIVFGPGHIEFIDSLGGGDLTGDIALLEGTVDKIFVTGDIGTPGAPVTILAGKDVTGLGTGMGEEFTIDVIACQGDIYANVIASDGADRDGKLRILIANEGTNKEGAIPSGTSDVRRNFTGSITAFESLNFDFDTFDSLPSIVAADFDGELFYYNKPISGIYLDSLSAASTISIGGQLSTISDPTGTEDSMIHIADADGLKGQIIVNANNNGSGWVGEIGIGGTASAPTLEFEPTAGAATKAPFYMTLPSVIGDGAIGRVPFNFHTRASTPIGDQYLTVDSTTIATAPVTIEHYGPVAENGLAAAAIKLEFYDGIAHQWDDVTSDFIVTASGREVNIKPDTGKQWELGIYRAEPDDLVCVGVPGNVQPVYDFASQVMGMTDYYVFMVMKDATGCPSGCGPGDPGFQGADTNGDGVVTPADFNAWILAWNNNWIQADQNCDGVIAPNDFNAWIINFNGDCH